MKKNAALTDSIRKFEKLYANMSVLARLQSLLNDYNADMDEAERIILTDGNLTAQVIKISNSVLYRRWEKATTLSTAVQTVGFKQILKLVGMALSKQVFLKDLDAYGVSADDFWYSGYFSALFLVLQGRYHGENEDEAYLTGLLHGVGKVVINELLRENEVEIYWDESIPSEDWENLMIGFGYDHAGALILDAWKFPKSIVHRVENQTKSEKIQSDPLLGALDYARTFLSRNIPGMPPETMDFCLSHPYLHQYEVDPATLKREINEVIADIAQVRETLASL